MFLKVIVLKGPIIAQKRLWFSTFDVLPDIGLGTMRNIQGIYISQFGLGGVGSGEGFVLSVFQEYFVALML